MTWSYGYRPHIWPSFLTFLLMIALAIYGGRRRSVPGALPFAIACLFFAPWAAGSALEIAAADAAAKIFWIKFQGLWQMFGVTAGTCFVLDYAWPGRWLTRRNLTLLSIPPLVTLGLALTDNLHHLFWRGFLVDGAVTQQIGPAGTIAIAYGQALIIVNLIALAWLCLHSPQHLWPVVIILTGQAVSRVLYLLDVSGAAHSDLALNVLGLAFLSATYAIALFGFRLFDPIALARQRVVEQLHAGILVLDSQGRVVTLNPAAEQILSAPASRAKGRPIRDLLPAYPDGPVAEGETEIDLSLPQGSPDGLRAGQEARHYALVTSLLKDWRGLEVGRLLLLRDVTEQKHAQEQLVERQRALAMLQEREWLARELHDSTGQALGATSLKVGAARKLIADGKLKKADDQLAHLESIVAAAHADVREYILNLRATPAEDRPFLPTLRHYLDGFRHNYDIQVELSVGAGVDEGVFAPEVRIQLFRIVQEALSNVRKHAQTSCVWLSFVVQGSLLCMRIQDNGQGFDPQQAAGADGTHFGLHFMRERAEQLGGTLRVQSTPGEGTCVEVRIPL